MEFIKNKIKEKELCDKYLIENIHIQNSKKIDYFKKINDSFSISYKMPIKIC